MRALLLTICALSVLGMRGQQYSFIEYGPDEGLPQSQVRCLHADSSGWLWVGTQEGVSRFDGRDFLEVPELRRTQINAIAPFPEGGIFIGYGSGFAHVRGNQLELHSVGDGVDAVHVSEVAKLPGRKLWVGTRSSGIWEQGDTSFVRVSNCPFDSLKNVRGLHIQEGNLIVADKYRVYRWDGSSATCDTLYTSPEGGAILNVTLDPDGGLWLSTKGSGVVHLKEGMPGVYSRDEGFVSNDANGAIFDRAGNIWISSRYGTSRFDGERFLNFTLDNGLPTEEITCIAQDYEGNIWFGTEGKGLLFFAGTGMVSFTTEDGLSSNLVMSIAEDADGCIWLATYDQGLTRISPEGAETVDLSSMNGSNRVWSAICDSQGRMWFGTSSGLWCKEGEKWLSYGTEDGLPSKVVLSLFEDENKRIWVGTYRGLCQVWEDKITELDYETGSWKKVRRITSDETGALWCATSTGIYVVDGQSVRHIDEPDGLQDRRCNGLFHGADGNTWISSRGGLILLRDGEMVAVTDDQLSVNVNFVTEWAGHLWAGNNHGVFHAPLEGFNPELTRFERLGVRDGLRSRETNQNAVLTDAQNQLWIGTVDGVSRLEPGILRSDESILPKVKLNDVRLNLKKTNWKARGVEISAISGLPEGLEVGHQDNHFTFHYRTLSMRYPESVSYRYRLLGFDDGWRPETSAEFATYSNLPYDAFTFEVQGRVGDGPWSSIQRFSFGVCPPFWLTWWFFLLEALVVAGIVWVIVDRRRRMLYTRLEKEKFEMKSRMQELEQQNLNSSMNRHFVFNALNSIQYYINRKDRVSANRYLTAFARLIRKNLDSSQDNLTSLRDEIERLELYLQLEHMRFHDKFEYHIEIGEDVDPDGIQVPAMLLQPFLENSIWHGILPKDAPGRVDVRIIRSNGQVEFTITDDGIGVEASKAKKQPSGSHVSKGMSITSDRLDLMRRMTSENLQLIGPYELRDDQAAIIGTEVKIILPLNFGEIYVN